MSKHEVDTSILVWAIRYLLSTDNWEVWDSIRVIRMYAPTMETNYLARVYEDVIDRQETVDSSDLSLVAVLEEIKEFLEETLQHRAWDYRS